jgi:hypothetical protein
MLAGRWRVSEPKDGWSLDRRGEHAMDAYYYGFTATGVEVIDRILAEVAWAGKAYHNTSQWVDDDNGESMVERIQTAADSAAAALPTPEHTDEEE